MEKLKATEGIKDVQVNDVTGESGVKVEIDYELANQLGLNIMSIGSTIGTAFSGQVVGDITLNDKDDIFVRLKDENHYQLKDLENLRIRNFKGDLVPLRLVAKFTETSPRAIP